MTEQPLSAAQRSRIRRLSTPAEPQAGDEAGELNVVPYLDIIMNMMMFVLVGVSVTFASTISTSAAHAGPTPPPGPQGLRLTALITGQGVALKTAGGAVAPGCGGIGAGVTVPNRGDTPDLAALSACARRIKGSAQGERQVAVSASPDVPYQTVIAVMDGLRADESGDLFPEVMLGAVR
jgi:biopolymer transport protein ExbD